MRPQTVSRLRVKDVDLEARAFNIDAKTGNYIRIIGDQLYEEYEKLDLKNEDPERFIFGRHGLIVEWPIKDENRREAYTNKFRPIKRAVSENPEHTIYSGRHSAAIEAFTNMCIEFKKQGIRDWKNEAVEQLRIFMDHKTKDDTKKYLRGISTEMHEDISRYL